MARKKASLLTDLFSIACALPWWISVVLAVAAGVYLHSIALEPLVAVSQPEQLASFMLWSVIRTFASVGQYLLPAILIAGAVASLWGQRSRRVLLDTLPSGTQGLESITWQQFERLVGETLRRKGFKVQELGGDGPDGGVDLIAYREGKKYLVQCKQWRSSKVGVSVVRELFGVMAASAAAGGFVVTSGRFTEEAKAFAAGRNLALVDGAELDLWISHSRAASAVAERHEPVLEAPEPPRLTRVEGQAAAMICPSCSSPMLNRIARKGHAAGRAFWGCSAFPKCRTTRPL